MSVGQGGRFAGPLAVLIAAVFIVPFNFPVHVPPLVSFYNEFLAFVLVVAAFAALCLRGTPVFFPPSGWLWIALAIWTALSPLFIDYAYTAQWLLPLSTFLAASGASVIGAQRGGDSDTAASLDLPAIAALGICLGAAWQSIAGWLQLVEWADRAAPLVAFFGFDARVVGNLGHQNIFGQAMAWGAMATLWLGVWRVGRPWIRAFTALLAAWFIFAGSWSGSRTFLLFLLFWALLAVSAILRTSDRQIRLWGAGLLLMVALGWTFQFAAQSIRDVIGSAFNTEVKAVSAVEAIDRGNFGERRWVEIRKAARVFLDHPAGGVGWGGYAAESFRLQTLDEFKDAEESVLFLHTHNGPAQLAAELGVFGIAVVLGVVYYLGRLFLRARAPHEFLVWSILGVVLLHSLLEYPLWYVYFLVAAAFLLALVERPKIFNPSRSTRKLVLAAALSSIAGAVLVAAAFHWVADHWTPEGTAADRRKSYDRLVQLRQVPMIDQWAEAVLVNHFPLGSEHAALRKEVVARQAKLRPFYYVQAKLVCELGVAKDFQARFFEYERLVGAYPDRKPELDRFFARYNC